MSLTVRTRLTANVQLHTPQTITQASPRLEEVCFYCHRPIGEHLGDTEQLFCHRDGTTSFSPVEPSSLPVPLLVFRTADIATKVVVITAALCLLGELINAFSTGAMERLVQR